MPCSYRTLPEAALVGGAILLQWKLLEWARAWPFVKRMPQLRVFFRAVFRAAAALLAVPVAVTGVGVPTNRGQFTVAGQGTAYPGLPADLDGLRIAHLSDIHLSPFLEAPELRRVIELANETRPGLVGSETLREAGAFNLLLSHNPDVFPTAAGQGWDLTMAGHAHGEPVTVKLLHQYLNVARVFTPYVYGTYREAGSAIDVTRGVGTVGVPARIGAPPEIGLIRLCAT